MNNLNTKKFNCTGCGACANICPTNAITIELDSEGFYQYKIDNTKCLNCGMCIKKCPKLSFGNSNVEKDVKCYAAYSKNQEIVKISSSGGIFYEVAKYFLENDGLVAAVTYENGFAKHILVNNVEELIRCCGSKYIQSETGSIFNDIKKVIHEHRVLFVGTPCQCAAAKLLIDHDNLFVIDVVCHGVSSVSVLNQAIDDRYRDKANDIKFRYKNNSWLNYEIAYLKNGKLYRRHKHYYDEWFNGYLKNIYLMKSCYDCGFAKLPRLGDITLGDFWGINIIDKEFFEKNGDRGISLLMINTSKGMDMYFSISEAITSKEENLKEAITYNPRINCGKYNCEQVKTRNTFFKTFQKGDFKKRRYSPSAFNKVNRLIKRIAKKIIGRK